MTPAERLARIFEGEMVDVVPFALKGWRIPQCEAELELRKAGMGIVDSRGVYSTVSPNVERASYSYTEGGIGLVRTVVKTPVGEVTSVSRRTGSERVDSTSWTIEHLFKGPEDYKTLRFMADDVMYAPAYEGFLRGQEQIGSEAFFKTGVPGCPLHTILYSFMGPETFAVEWAERRDEIVALHYAMAARDREAFEIAARSPARVVQSGGNYAPEMMGKERFCEFVLPHWDEAAAILHEGGKLLGSHLDANNMLWAREIGSSPLDWIEAFTPAPDTDMTMADARHYWPGKVLYINFPSSVHLQPAAEIEQVTRQMLEEVAPGDRFIIGITETVPEDRWRESFGTILRTLNEYGRLPI